jgi:hypothetical protein
VKSRRFASKERRDGAGGLSVLIMNVEWCLEQLRRMREALTFEVKTGSIVGSSYHVYNASDVELHAQAQVVDQILDRVVPQWKEHKPADPTAGKPKWRHHRRWVEQAIAALERQEEVDAHLGSQAPQIAVDQFHPWVWESAKIAWEAGSYGDGVRAAARAISAKARQKLGRRDLGEWKLLTQAFDTKAPAPGHPRFRLTPDDGSDTFVSLHQGAAALARGLYQAVRNPANHEDADSELEEHRAVEALAAFSMLARFVDEADIETT